MVELFILKIFIDMSDFPAIPDLDEELEKVKQKIQGMSQAEKAAFIRDMCSRIEETRHALLEAHKQNKSPMECVQAATDILEQIGQPKTIN